MTIEVVCPACRSGYVLDSATVGDEFHCPSCSHASSIEQSRPPSAPRAARRVAPRAAPAPRTEIVCPRCKLHFAPEKHTVEVQPGDRPSILIVEAEGYTRDSTADALSGVYDIVTAGTVDAATRILALGGIDLMILDLDIDYGFGRRLLNRTVSKTCPIVVIGNDESQYYGDEWEALRELGADAMVIKGMNAAEAIVRKVGELLGRIEGDEGPS